MRQDRALQPWLNHCLSKCQFLICNLGKTIFAGSHGCCGVKRVSYLVRCDVLYTYKVKSRNHSSLGFVWRLMLPMSSERPYSSPGDLPGGKARSLGQETSVVPAQILCGSEVGLIHSFSQFFPPSSYQKGEFEAIPVWMVADLQVTWENRNSHLKASFS